MNTSPEKNQIQDKFDVILNLEVIEHVENVDLFMKSATELLKKNGIMFIATINRTFESYIKAIVGAEYILRWLPIGTHDWQKFLTPDEIEQKFNKLNLDKLDLTGLKYNIFSNNWAKSKDCSVNYILLAKKISYLFLLSIHGIVVSSIPSSLNSSVSSRCCLAINIFIFTFIIINISCFLR